MTGLPGALASLAVLVALLAFPGPGRAVDEAPPPSVPEVSPSSPEASPSAPTTPTPAAEPASGRSPWTGAYLAAGYGTYEAAHVTAAYRFDGDTTTSVLLGAGTIGAPRTFTVGVGAAVAVAQPTAWLEAGLDAKLIYWVQSDRYYHWQIFTLRPGGYLLAHLDPRLGLRLDAGAALSAALVHERKLDDQFGYPRHLNFSACLELRYLLDLP